MNRNETHNLCFCLIVCLFFSFGCFWFVVCLGGRVFCLLACFGGKTKQHNSLV